jgi:hypothetical protein
MLFRHSEETAKRKYPDYELANAVDLANPALAAIKLHLPDLPPKPLALQLQLPGL